MKESFYITTTLPYVNAKPHIGHALEFIRADAIARYKALQGHPVFFNTGADEHGLKIYQKAQAEGKEIQTYVDENAEHIKTMIEMLGMATDVPNITFNFSRTTDEKHIKAAQKFWKLCDEKGFIEKRTYKGLYCVGDELFMTEKELVNGRCPNHPDQELEEIEEENYFFKASSFTERLLEEYEKNPQFILPEARLNEMKSLLKQHGLEDFSISRVKEKMPWGVPVPGDEDQVMYVWFDALINYIVAIGWPDDMESFEKWGRMTQYCGKDNTRQQSAMWQAMLLSVGLPLSKQIIVNGFVTAEGGIKMSKSLGNVVDPVELINEYGTDALRYYVLREVHPFEDSAFTLERFKETYNANLVNGLGNLLSRVLKMSEDFGVQYTEEQIGEIIERIEEDVFELNREYRTSIESFNLMSAMDEIWKEVKSADTFIQETAPFKMVKENKTKAQEDVYTCILSLIKIAHMLRPMMPDTAEKMFKSIRVNKKPEESLFPRK